MWEQFRRLLLGTVVEALLDHGVDVDFRTIHIEFDDDSVFKVPRLDNYMRFKGELAGSVLTPLADADVEAMRATLARAWPTLLAVLDIPIGDRLTLDQNDIRVVVEEGPPQRLRVVFDLIAD